MNITSTSYDELLALLARNLGMELAFENDVCELLLDGQWSLNIARVPNESRIVLSSVVLETLPDEISYAALTDLLAQALNPMYGTGPAVGIDPESGTMIAYVSIHLSKIEPDQFPAIVAKFMEYVLAVNARLTDDEADAEEASLAPSSFLRV